MPCFYPLKGFRSRLPTKTGKHGVVFNSQDGYLDLPVEISCGQCIGCRLERSRQWAVRCMHEASLYERNCFITLTYSPEFVPEGHTLVKADFQKFMKRLRFSYGSGVRYFQCGEYGERFGRPHYHACLFNFDFDDRVYIKSNDRGDKLYSSEKLKVLWPFGDSTVGDVTFDSAAYVARYVLKKVYGDDARGVSNDGCPGHYTYMDESTGEFYERLPEYVTMSRGGKYVGLGGIGKPWLDKYMTDVYPDNFVIVRGIKMAPPKYYRSLYELDNPPIVGVAGFARKSDEVQFLVDKSKRLAFVRRDNNTRDRLAVREIVLRSKLTQLNRSIDNDN